MNTKGRFFKALGLAIAIGVSSVASMGYAQTSRGISVTKQITLSKPEIYRTAGTTYIGAASVFKALGNQVTWIQESKQLLVDGGRLVFTLGQTQVATQNSSLKLERVPVVKEGKFYMPLSFFGESLGYEVTYKEGVVKISGQEQVGYKGSYEEEIKEKKITISAAGDFTLGYYKGQGTGGRFDEVAKSNGYSYFMEGVKSVFEKDDLTIINLEGPLTTRGVASEKQFAIRGLPDYTQILTLGSIEAVNLANNHTYDYQKVGYEDTVSALKQSSIGYFGEENTYYTSINEIRVALIGANGWNNSSGVKEKLKKRIDEAKEKADLIIVEFHWGVERDNYPNTVQQDLGKYVIDQGAHLVLGSHPHVIQGIGSYKGASIVYSMGNFCFGANKNPTDKDTFIYQETFVLTDEGIQSEGSEVIPCSISSTSSKNDYQPTLLTGAAKERVLNRMATYSKNLKS